MSQLLNKFSKDLRLKASAIAKNHMKALSDAYIKISDSFDSKEERLKKKLKPCIEQALSNGINSQDEQDLKKFIVAALCSSDSEGLEGISLKQLTVIVDLLIHEVKSAKKLEEGEITFMKVLNELENKFIIILKKLAKIAFKTILGAGVSLAVTAVISHFISPPDQLPTILSVCIIPMIKTGMNDEANSLIHAGMGRFKNLFT